MSFDYAGTFCRYRKVRLAVVPTRRDTFPKPADAVEHKKQVMPVLLDKLAKIHDVDVVLAEELLPDGLLCDQTQVESVYRYLREQEVDALFVPHMNFGLEEAVAQLAYRLQVPVLLWGPRDGEKDTDDNVRTYDTQCGMFATSRALLRYGVKFTYIENCWLDDPQLDEGLEMFIRAVSVVKAFKGLRVLQIVNRPRQFLSVKINEGELLEKFGVEIVPVTAAEYIEAAKDAMENDPEGIKEVIDDIVSRIKIEDPEAEWLRKTAALFIGNRNLAQKYGCSTVASECWEESLEAFGIMTCLSNALLTEKGLPVACECDINGAITSVLVLAAARGETTDFFADITVRHPHNDNAELLWHCGNFPPALSGAEPVGAPDGRVHFEAKKGDITIARFDGDRGNYMLLCEEGKAVDGPKTHGGYVWFEHKDWPALERKLMFGPYIHHCVGAYGHYKEALREACMYMGITLDEVK